MRSNKGIGGIITALFAAFASISVSFVGAGIAIQTGLAVEDDLDTGGGQVKLSAAANQAMKTDMGQSYSGRTTATIISYILSTPGDTIHVNGKSVQVSRARADVKEALKSDLEKSLLTSTRDIEYRFTVETLGGGDQSPNTISVESASDTSGGEFVTQNIYLWNDQRARATLYVSKQGGVGLYR